MLGLFWHWGIPGNEIRANCSQRYHWSADDWHENDRVRPCCVCARACCVHVCFSIHLHTRMIACDHAVWVIKCASVYVCVCVCALLEREREGGRERASERERDLKAWWSSSSIKLLIALPGGLHSWSWIQKHTHTTTDRARERDRRPMRGQTDATMAHSRSRSRERAPCVSLSLSFSLILSLSPLTGLGVFSLNKTSQRLVERFGLLVLFC